MGRGNRQLKRFTSWLVLVSFMASLMAPVVEGAALIPLKVPGRHVLFDVNSATVSELASIPGIGPKTAAEIVRHRTQFGPFKTIQDVGVVPGVGKARLAKLTGAATQGSRSDLRLRTQTAAPKEVVRQATPVKTVSSAVEGLARTLQPVWVTGSNGVKVNVNIPDTKTLVSNLSRAGFSDVQVNTIANTRLMSDPSGTRLSFKPVTGITDLQARLGTAGLKGVIDSTGTLVSRQPAVQSAPAAPQSAPKAVPGVGGKGLVYATGDRLMFRFDGNGKPVTVNLNQQSATGLFKQLRDAGVPSGTAKAVAQARMKGSFQSFQDLAARVPSVETVAKAPATRSSISAPVEAPRAPAPVAPPAPPAYEVELARLTKQHQAIANRTPSSVTGYDRTLKSLQDTYDGMFKSLAKKASAANPGVSADSVAKDPRLQSIARDIDVYNKGKANLVKAETLNKAKVAVDAEIAKYSQQAEAVQARKPTSVKGFDTTVDSLKATYRDLYNRLEMKARLEGKVSAESIVKDPRLQKLAESIDSVRTAKSDFQTQKAANVEQARVNAEKAAARKAKVAASETAPAAPETPAAKTEPKAPSKQAASQPEVVSAPKPAAEAAARIETLSAKTKSLFSEIRAESGGRFTSNKDVWEAARHYRGEGKLAELRKTASELQQLRNARLNQATAEAPAAPAAEKPVAKAKPAAEPVAAEQQVAKGKTAPVQETVAPVEQTAPAKAMTETQLLSQQAKDLTARLVKEGRFTNAREVYQASETGGAKGELAQLKSINDKIRANRAANKPAAPAAETAPTGTKSATAEPVAAVEPTPAKAKVAASETGVAAAPAAETAAPKGKWTDGFLKALKGGQYKSTEGGWADGYLKMLKGDGAHVTGQPVEPAPVEGIGRASET
ncbi:MAG: helix-hairpin-helix domain-containing protein, partial [Candidatus Wallbacteria bacterium]|nr:helix-hairpin-helix domain-containing protein [Candidatus Wallbacteria bacterium]